MNLERFARQLARPLALATLPLLAACGSGENNHISPAETAVVTPIATPKENVKKPDETISIVTASPTATPTATPEQNDNEANRTPNKEELIALAHSVNMGVVLVSVRWQESTPVMLKFRRLDIDENDKSEDDEVQITLNKNIPYEDGIALAAFFATSCDGRYNIGVSADGGKTYNQLDFELDPQTCTREVNISLGRREQLS